MDSAEARSLVERCLPSFPAAGLPPLEASQISDVACRKVAGLWAGFGAIYELRLKTKQGDALAVVAKRVQLPHRCKSIGDQRKKDSYDVEAAFYLEGHAARLLAAGCIVPFPLHVEASRGENVTICMTRLEPKGPRPSDSASAEAFLCWLARLHATYWGHRSVKACSDEDGGRLQRQGCYWHLDTRPEEHRELRGSSGWLRRLGLAARAIDIRLKKDPFQTVCHGDAKGANIMYAMSDAGEIVPQVYDFQYCGRGAATKDLAYFLNVEVLPGATEELRLLKFYYAELSRLLEAVDEPVPSFESLLISFELALCDWRRFSEVGLGGWGDSGANRRVEKVLDELDGGRVLATEAAYEEAMEASYPC